MHGIELEFELWNIDHAMHQLVLALAYRQDRAEVWYHVHGMLTAAAMVSKTLWPIRRVNQARGELLRSVFKVPADSPFQSRRVRDGFEHFDERIDRFAGSGQAVLDRIVGTPDSWGT